MTANDAPIAVLDSGVGGLPYLERAMELLPEESFVYVADSASFPYGNRAPDELISIVSSTVRRIATTFRPKALLLACNTASVVALATLRAEHSFPIVGVVPAVKPAGAASENRRIGLLATDRTVLDSYTDDLIRRFASDCHIERVGDGRIVSFVEYEFLDADEPTRFRAVESAATRFRSARIDTLIIGCTHFIFVEEYLKQSLPGDVAVIDSRDGVARQLERVVDRVGRGSPTVALRALAVTGDDGDADRFRRFASRFSLEYLGPIG